MNRRGNILLNLDWATIIIYLLLMGLGWLNIFASEYNEPSNSRFLSFTYGKQFLWILFSLAIAISIMIVDSKFYSLFAYPTYIFMILVLIAVLVFGTEIKGAKSWFRFGSVQVQPAEFAKFATCLALAKFLSSYNKKIHQVKNLLLMALIIGLPMMLIVLQHDAGSALVYTSLILVLYREGLSGVVLLIGLLIISIFIAFLIVDKIIILAAIFALAFFVLWIWEKKFKYSMVSILIIAGFSGLVWIIGQITRLELSYYYVVLTGTMLSAVVLLIMAGWHKIQRGLLLGIFFISSLAYTEGISFLYNMLGQYQQKRILVTLGIESDPSGAGYNLHQSKLAISSGGMFGKGFMQGTHTKGDYVPEQSTDFIFCTVGEEWGFAGSLLLIALLLTLLLRLIKLAERQRSVFSRVYGYGVVAILFYHMAVNISMTIGLFPVMGIPLPFFSYGGSSLWAFTILLFIFIRLDASRLEFLR